MILITDEEIQVLNAARTILINIDARACEGIPEDGEEGHALGRLATASFAAHGLVFSVLNIAKVYCDVEMTDAQLHNNPSVVLDLPRPKPRSVAINSDNGKKGER